MKEFADNFVGSQDQGIKNKADNSSVVSKMIELTRAKGIPVINEIHGKYFVVTPQTNIKELDEEYLKSIQLNQFEEKDPDVDSYSAPNGVELAVVAEDMLRLAEETKRKIKVEFKGKDLIADKNSTAESIINAFNDENNVAIKDQPIMVGVGLDGNNVYKFDSRASGSIEQVAKEMVELAQKTKGKVVSTFNGKTIAADENSNEKNIIATFIEDVNASSKEYRSSDEYKKETERRKEKDKEDLAKSKLMMEELPQLDFNDYTKVLDWLCEFEELSNIGNTQAELAKIFIEHGFKPEAEIINDFDSENRESVARRIIGMAIGYSSIPQVIHSFTEKWKKKFEQ